MKGYIHIHKEQGIVADEEKLLRWFKRLLKSLPDGDHEFWHQPTNKTKAQNNYYWSQVSNMAEYLGMDADELHDELKEMFLPKEKYIVLIKERQIESTRGLRRDWMSLFIDKCARWAADVCSYVWGDPEEYKHM